MVQKPAKYKNLFLILIILASFFMSIGFANINSIINTIETTANIIIKKKLHINNVEVNQASNGLGEVSFYDGTYFYTTSTLSKTDPTSSVTYTVTIVNSTPYRYGYIDAKYMLGEDTYDNENIIFEINGMNEETILESGDSITFNVTFKYNDPTNTNNNVLNAGINFIFKNLSAMQLSSLIELNESNINDSGLIEYNNKKYFVGTNVNNYIWFNCEDDYSSGAEHCERWRIVSIEPNNNVKIVKDDVVTLETIVELENDSKFWFKNTGQWMTDTKILAQGKVIYDPKGRRPINKTLENSYCINTNNGCNAYAGDSNTIGKFKEQNVDEDSLLKIYLENIYYPNVMTKQAKEQIAESVYNIGLVGIGYNIDEVINQEKSITINTNIGLLNPSDFVIASNDELCKTEFTRYHNTNCKKNNWLILPDKQHQMMNGKVLTVDDKHQQIWTIKGDGAIVSQDANNEFFLRPVVILDSNVQAIGLGTNNEENYYMIVT